MYILVGCIIIRNCNRITLVYSQPYRVFKVELYKTHIAAFNEYTEYHINFDDTSKYYTLVISGMQFLIVSDLGWCNIWQVFNTDTPVTTDCKQETETNCEQVYDVAFNDDTASNCKHINSTYECCMQVNTGNYAYTIFIEL